MLADGRLRVAVVVVSCEHRSAVCLSWPTAWAEDNASWLSAATVVGYNELSPLLSVRCTNLA